MTAAAITSVGGIRGSTPTRCSHDHHVDLWSGDDVFDRYIADELNEAVTPGWPSPTAAPTSTTPSPPVRQAPLLQVPVDGQPMG
jgi:hypothetical protein